MKKLHKIYATVTVDGETRKLTWSRENIGDLINNVYRLMVSDMKHSRVEYTKIAKVYK